MKRCPITYELISDNEFYSKNGLKLLSPQLQQLDPLGLSAEEQRQEAVSRAGKMSIQGVQTKLSAQLKIKEGYFKIVDQQGQYILKTQSAHYPELPENEAVTMGLAATIGIEVPVHGLVYAKDNSMTYFIKRFDRVGRNKKLALEDFSQLSGNSRDTKYQSSMEQVIDIIAQFCTFPKIEFIKLFKLTLFNYLVGNEDMHLKNFSIITKNQKNYLSPAYDLLNTTIVMMNPKEELALPLKGKKNNLTKKDFLTYFANERLRLNQIIIDEVICDLIQKIPSWFQFIDHSFLSIEMKEKYKNLVHERSKRLFN
ncbi:HipA domain-containing protein [Legionella maioricensis]|uniref:HipA domain-containing protein n=1 Tax=Legionella maioricensis TaxID=2896528 RepID=A0A9X2ICC5_9GAMM|nr:HipA domain-containing protein [Legionella maioricensis]MCL9683618.1 HipA domain-containing protein [Legionella maioricensis]MCL9687640.1 HipA domain-containing protein [Legionella maioricensis]